MVEQKIENLCVSGSSPLLSNRGSSSIGRILACQVKCYEFKSRLSCENMTEWSKVLILKISVRMAPGVRIPLFSILKN